MDFVDDPFHESGEKAKTHIDPRARTGTEEVLSRKSRLRCKHICIPPIVILSNNSVLDMLGSAGFYRHPPSYLTGRCSIPTSHDRKAGIRSLSCSVICGRRTVTFSRRAASNIESCGQFLHFVGRCFKPPCLQRQHGKDREQEEAQHTIFAVKIGMKMRLAYRGMMRTDCLFGLCEGRRNSRGQELSILPISIPIHLWISSVHFLTPRTPRRSGLELTDHPMLIFNLPRGVQIRYIRRKAGRCDLIVELLPALSIPMLRHL